MNVDEFGTTDQLEVGRERERECKILTGARLSPSCPTLCTQTSLPLLIAAKVARRQNWIPSFPGIAPGWRCMGAQLRPEEPNTNNLKIWLWPSGNHGCRRRRLSAFWSGGLACRRVCPPAHIRMRQPYTASRHSERASESDFVGRSRSQ